MKLREAGRDKIPAPHRRIKKKKLSLLSRTYCNPSSPCQPSLQRWPHQHPPCFITPLHPLVLHLPSTFVRSGDAPVRLSERALVNFVTHVEKEEIGRLSWGNLSLRLEGAESCSSSGPSQMWHTPAGSGLWGPWIRKEEEDKDKRACR